MRSLSPYFFLLFLLVLFVNLSDGRKDPEDYWKKVMKGEPMPKAIEELVHGGQEPLSGHFKRDFDTKRNQIIYHGHVEPKKVIPFFEDLKKIGHHEIESEG
ncbi:Ankyrin repeat domain-containing protein [Actinidia chinensis var. chinensis]|uniref:Ankyrin repeat domain-containing protein n=1 Tax=Actinidia chinensis var. chinensis TaxID=1590841 RepID=A0A2R6RBV6_ACTCC|nr:Ankyrin repeat domain-containing protein [Actinidia chinensis var. chinensis]